MNIVLLGILLIPFIIHIIAKFIWADKISWRMLAFNIGATTFLIITVFEIGKYNTLGDLEIWNGKITHKYVEKYICGRDSGCRHSYQCNCVNVCSGGKNETCTQICQTCYDYEWEQDWWIDTTIGKYDLDRGDRQGKYPSSKWEHAQVDDPVSDVRKFDNYVKAVPDSLFNDSQVDVDKKLLAKVPNYPLNVYELLNIDRVFPIGFTLTPNQKKDWNKSLQTMLGDIGPSKQVNAVILLVKGESRSFINAVKVKWIGGKKNDVIVLVGLTPDNKIDWEDVISWSKEDVFNVVMRDEIRKIDNFSLDKPDTLINVMKTVIVDHFVRRPMEEFSYLKNEIKPPTWVIILALVLGLGLTSLVIWVEVKDDLYGY